MSPAKIKNFILVAFILAAGGAVYFSHELATRPPVVKGDTTAKNQLLVDFFDVGQGDSELIRTPSGQDILVDGGPDNKVLEKLGQYLPLGDNDLELVILTHPHADHVTGLVEVLKRYKVDKILMTGAFHTASDYLTFLNLIKEKNIPVEIVNSQKQIMLDASTTIETLWPNKNISGVRFDNLNNSSIVFRLVYASTSALFMGDLENEEELASSSPQLLKSDLLKVGHHGSNNANDQNFLAAVSPKYAVIEVGVNNSYGLPAFRVIHYLEELGTKIFRTDQDGDIVFVSDGKDFSQVK